MNKKKKIIIAFGIVFFSWLISVIVAAYLNSAYVINQPTNRNLNNNCLINYSYEIISKEEDIYTIALNLINNGKKTISFFDINISIPNNSEVIDINNAIYKVNDNILTISNIVDDELTINKSILVELKIKTSSNLELNNFKMNNCTVTNIEQSILSAVSELTEVNDNIYTYKVIIENRGSKDSDTWSINAKLNKDTKVISSSNSYYIHKEDKLILNATDDTKVIKAGRKLNLIIKFEGVDDFLIIDIK